MMTEFQLAENAVAEPLKRALSDRFSGSHLPELVVLESCTSTMDLFRLALDPDEIKRLGLESLPNPLVIVSGEQSQGRGRHSRQWVSQPWAGVYLTYGVSLNLLPEELLGLPLVLGCALSRAATHFGADVGLKWPNDLWGRCQGEYGKVAGILAEGLSGGNVSVGIGVNLSQRIENSPYPVFNLSECGATVEYSQLLAELVFQMNSICDQFRISGVSPFLREWEERSWMIGSSIATELRGEELRGTVLGIDHRGGLRIRTAEGVEETLYSNEVSIREWHR